MTTNPPDTPAPLDGRLRFAAITTLVGLLLVMALRLTMTESLNESFAQVNALFYARVHPPGGVLAPEIGPAVTLGLATATLLLAAIAAGIAGLRRALTPSRGARLLLIAAILGLGIAATFAAAGKFVSLVGVCDLALSLLAGWSIGLLCQPALLGSAGRRIVVAALVAILAVWIAKGIYQRTVEIPDTIDYYEHHRDEALQSQGIRPSQPGAKLYESRMHSKEVTGYVTLSNVMGAGLIGLLAALAGILAGKMVSPEQPEPPAETRRSKSTVSQPAGSRMGGGNVEISSLALLLFFAIALVPLGVLTLILTESRGGSILGIAVVAAIFLGAYGWQQVVAHRRAIIAAFVLLWITATAALVGYGITHDRLPTKSLMFRWHYWTAAAPLIQQHPLTGVGLNNFGDYYASVKRLSSPETVQDPHSFFIRLAAEMGLPATLLIALLIIWCAFAATCIPKNPDTPAAEEEFLPLSLLGAAFCALWWLLHGLLAETSQEWSVILCCFAAIIAFGGWIVAAGLLVRLNARGLRITTLALLAGALGMLAYDQINMALVTGPVATFFWILLMTADSYDGAPHPAHKALGITAGLALAAAALCVAAFAWYPTLNGTMPWDDRPFIDRYLAAVSFTPQNLPAAKEAIAKAIALNPRSVALRRQQMLLKEQLHEPVEEDEKQIIALDHTDMRLRLNMATEPSSLSPAERVRLLERILFLDKQLPEKEITRLTDDERKQIEAALARYQPATRAQNP
ncbi:MAG: O-antigen ligase family protein [Phycisphaerae bacterium]